MSDDRGDSLRVFLSCPGYGHLTGGASRGLWRATRLPDSQVFYSTNESSLLAANFNSHWCTALNLARAGRAPTYFAMMHTDVQPQDWWLDTLIAELEERELDLLGVVVPIKDQKGLTSTALAREDGDTWRIKCRLTMSEVYRLPPTFTSDDLGHPLLLNTGLWVCRFDESWARKVHFTINDRIVQRPDGSYTPQCEPEDWFFSRLCHELKLRIGCTRKVRLTHRGGFEFPNSHAWGSETFDREYVPESVVPEVDRDGFRFPHDVDGWLRFEEGKELWRLAHGKRVLEIGSYMGLSTICLAQSAESVAAVDYFDGRGTFVPQDTFPKFRENLNRYGVTEKVSIYNPDDGAQLPECDFAFIDGAHDADSVRADIEKARNVLTPGGLIAFHDYHSPHDPGVTEAVDELLAAGGELLFTHSTLAVVRPPAAVPLEV